MKVQRKNDCWYKEVCSYDSCINCIRYAELKFLMEHSGIPKVRQKPVSLDPGVDYYAFCDLADIKDTIVDYVNRENTHLYICSEETGNGKTSWAIKLLLKYFDEIWAGNGFRVRGYFQHVPALLNTLKDFSNPHNVLKKTLENADLVVWDDIAGAKLSDYDIQQLLILLDNRIIEDKTNIYTGNLTSYEALKKVLGSRLASRIWNCSTIVKFKGKDRR